MSLQHIIDAANQLASEGKKPSVALIKSRITQPTNLREIIETLRKWSFDPHASIATADKSVVAAAAITDPITALIAQEIAAIRAEIAPLRQQVGELKAEISALKKALLTQ